ncbi:hypothetical protein [Mycobacteroides abscessus]|uniref:hypothetical protein n=1 Tax=Mycobacteroides abscessus TaxID=36809 RepID=UPI00092B058C|nr:hypothetical protein [Mycobacteroides abscessus]QSN49753.1 hypothetical protein I3U33_26860 [Mycobacteroides abscessus subsp. abscessus]SII84043.1 Uncharacterised protein [Mycobacteroides abscessus subsp. abscessus]SIK56975.1 Uncharacterised protein [Mycobacteroides abscessus subsp. abscessus]SIL84404.1 Uncharacterised protein [Mycobacteroides abscessus subsp. abscessus]SIM12144.1 Uncharacterised protein [Mycobacteroides abscessus subsp. abscessus]
MSEVIERDMLDLLLARYTAIRRGTIADRWVRAEHVSSTLGHYRPGVSRIVDFVVADKYPGIPYGSALAFHGHEVKVTRSDWLTELRDPSKSEAWRRYMHFWWLVVPDAAIVRDGELPDGWGLLVKSGGGLRAKVRASRQEPEPMPADMCIALMAASARDRVSGTSTQGCPIESSGARLGDALRFLWRSLTLLPTSAARHVQAAI